MFRFTAVLVCAAATLRGRGRSRIADEARAGRLCHRGAERRRPRSPPSRRSTRARFRGLLRMLDPHSVFFDPGQFEQLKKMESSTQKGFGSVVSLLPGRVIVLADPAGHALGQSRACRRATRSWRSTATSWRGWISSSSRELLTAVAPAAGAARRAPARLGAHHALRADARGDADRPAWSARSSSARASATSACRSFDENTAAQIREAIEKLGGDRLAGLVLDLRNNPGGLVAAAHRDRLPVSQARPEDRHRARPQRPGEIRSGPAGCQAVRVQAGHPGQREDRQRVGDRLRGHAGPRPRHHPRRAELRQGTGAERLPAERGHRAGAHHGALLHAQRPLHSEAAGRRAASSFPAPRRTPTSKPNSAPTRAARSPAAAASSRISWFSRRP